MTVFSRRSIFASVLIAGLLPSAPLFAADSVKTISIDWATYNPVSMVLKQQGLLEKEFAKDGITVRWVQTLGSNKALEFLNAGSIDFGSTAGSAALVARINGNPIKSIYVYSQPEWTALVTRKDTTINKVADLKGKRVAVTRGTDPHIFLVRALLDAGLTEKDITPVLLQHPDGKTALIRGDVDAWAGLDPMMAAAEVEDGARLFYRNAAANTWGILNVRGVRENHPTSSAACSWSMSRRASSRWRTTTKRRCSSPSPSCPTRYRQAAQGRTSSRSTRSARSSATRSCRRASRCRRRDPGIGGRQKSPTIWSTQLRRRHQLILRAGGSSQRCRRPFF